MIDKKFLESEELKSVLASINYRGFRLCHMQNLAWAYCRFTEATLPGNVPSVTEVARQVSIKCSIHQPAVWTHLQARHAITVWYRLFKILCNEEGVAITHGRQPRKERAPRVPKIRNPGYTRQKYLAFLESQEWYRFRYQILRTHGAKCALCKTTEGPIQVDHIVAASVDWSRRLDPTNAQPLCRPCNVGKSNLYSDDWRTVQNKT